MTENEKLLLNEKIHYLALFYCSAEIVLIAPFWLIIFLSKVPQIAGTALLEFGKVIEKSMRFCLSQMRKYLVPLYRKFSIWVCK